MFLHMELCILTKEYPILICSTDFQVGMHAAWYNFKALLSIHTMDFFTSSCKCTHIEKLNQNNLSN